MKIKIALISAFVILIILLAIQSFRLNSQQKKNQVQAVELMAANDSALAYKTKSGEAYFKLSGQQIESNALKASVENYGLQISDLRQRDVKWRDVISVLKSQLAMSGNDTITLHDTLYKDNGVPVVAKAYQWSNGFLSLGGSIKDEKMAINYSYKTDLSFVAEKKGNNITVTAFMSDPKAKIIKGSQIIVRDKTKWYLKPWLWGIIGVGTGFCLAK